MRWASTGTSSNNVKYWFDYANTEFKDGAGTAAAPKNRPNESVIESQLQVAFGGSVMFGRKLKLTYALAAIILAAGVAFGAGAARAAQITLLNVSYDPTRELYQDFNPQFAQNWKAKTGDDVTITIARRLGQTSPGGHRRARSGRRDAGLADDIDAIAKRRTCFRATGKHACPRTARRISRRSSSSFATAIRRKPRLGRPGQAGDKRDDAESEDVGRGAVGLPRGVGLRPQKNNRDEDKAEEFVTALYKNVPVLDSGARGSTTTFVERGIGDVLLGWENEADALKQFGKDKFEIVYPSISIWPSRRSRGSTRSTATTALRLSKAYLEYLYSEEGQEIGAKNFYRPRDPTSRRNMQANFRSRCSRSTRISAAGKCRRNIRRSRHVRQIYKPGN